jgi:hypothetical protein
MTPPELVIALTAALMRCRPGRPVVVLATDCPEGHLRAARPDHAGRPDARAAPRPSLAGAGSPARGAGDRSAAQVAQWVARPDPGVDRHGAIAPPPRFADWRQTLTATTT